MYTIHPDSANNGADHNSVGAQAGLHLKSFFFVHMQHSQLFERRGPHDVLVPLIGIAWRTVNAQTSLADPHPRGGTLIFSRIRRLGPFFWVQNSEFQYFWGFSEK